MGRNEHTRHNIPQRTDKVKFRVLLHTVLKILHATVGQSYMKFSKIAEGKAIGEWSSLLDTILYLGH